MPRLGIIRIRLIWDARKDPAYLYTRPGELGRSVFQTPNLSLTYRRGQPYIDFDVMNDLENGRRRAHNDKSELERSDQTFKFQPGLDI